MLNKIFIVLLVLSVLGSGVLFWLMRSTVPAVPGSRAQKDSHASSESHSSSHSTDGHETSGKEKESAPSTTVEESSTVNAEGEKHGEVSSNVEKSPESRFLVIRSTPEKANVFVDNSFKGVTPLELPISESVFQVKVEASGFEAFLREAPTLKLAEGSGNVHWNIQLKKIEGAQHQKSAGAKGAKVQADAQSSSPALARGADAPQDLPHGEEKAPVAAPAKIAKKSSTGQAFASGLVGPASIQVKSFPVAESALAIAEINEARVRLSAKVTGCKVSVQGKGDFLRVLVGPYGSRRLAMRDFDRVKAVYGDAFLVSSQNCEALVP